MSDLTYTDDNGHKRCRNCNGDWTEFASLRAKVAELETENERLTRDRMRVNDRFARTRDANTALHARIEQVQALCDSFDPTSGSGRARTFVSDLRTIVDGAE